MLSVRDHMTLALAAAHYRHAGKREADARELLGYTAVGFWREVNRLLDRDDVLAAYPMEVRRLRRLREARAGVRAASRVGA